MPEKDFNLESDNKMVVPLSVRKTIDTLNWNYFYDAQSLPEEELVQDFYANLTVPNAIEVVTTYFSVVLEIVVSGPQIQ
ncbi:hypothetical protein PVK06_008825 [Gossypium arboreum]|uniref:Uncharacterized protein n=1 Tax=Gossypium arboreum TaxID=29729 RepID=A0ABR0QKX1_GOSAR|nr:hypothetical protein PVK06_008825 [Gossypium arboreum]